MYTLKERDGSRNRESLGMCIYTLHVNIVDSWQKFVLTHVITFIVSIISVFFQGYNRWVINQKKKKF